MADIIYYQYIINTESQYLQRYNYLLKPDETR